MLVYVLICWAMYTVKGFHIVLSSSTFYGLCRQDSDYIQTSVDDLAQATANAWRRWLTERGLADRVSGGAPARKEPW